MDDTIGWDIIGGSEKHLRDRIDSYLILSLSIDFNFFFSRLNRIDSKFSNILPQLKLLSVVLLHTSLSTFLYLLHLPRIIIRLYLLCVLKKCISSLRLPQTHTQIDPLSLSLSLSILGCSTCPLKATSNRSPSRRVFLPTRNANTETKKG